MNWKNLAPAPWLDTRASFVAKVPAKGCLLDLGASDGETLCHIRELRPDLHLRAVDLEGSPEKYPAKTDFAQADLQKDTLPWPSDSVDGITCMHLVEHLNQHDHLLKESMRLLRPGGRLYIETPHPKTLSLPSPPGTFVDRFTLNFYDDITHTQIVSMGAIGKRAVRTGFEIEASGTSRNLLFAASWLFYQFLPPSRKSLTAKIHWIGWSAFIILRKPEH